jgi:elongation factor Ts
MSIDIALIQKIRKQTGAGLADVKNALEVANGDEAAALEELRKKGAKNAAKRADRETNEGLVHAYIHGNGQIGAIIALGCETDFVARNDQFKDLANDIALHIVASMPEYVFSDQIPADIVAAKKEELSAELKEEGKPENMIEQIVEGKMNKWFEEVCLLNQKYVKDDSMTIQDLLTEKIGTIGEKIEVLGFSLQSVK